MSARSKVELYAAIRRDARAGSSGRPPRREETLRSTTKRRYPALIAGMLLMLGAHVLTGTPQAAAMPNLQKVTSPVSPTNSVSPKTASAVCPAGTKVIGGGGWVFAIAAADERKVVLTRLEPRTTTSQSSYIVTGQEVAPGMSGNWWVQAYALCASTPAGYEIVSASTVPSSTGTQQTAAICTGNKRVFGTGARIDNPGGQVTLQLTRSDIPRGIGRVTAKEDANGYSGTWNVTAFAVCANDQSGFTIKSNGTPTNSDATKIASVTCPTGTFVHSTAVASSGTPPGLNTTPPGVAVQVLYPFNNLRSAQVFAVETTPTSVNWDVGIFVICGP